MKTDNEAVISAQLAYILNTSSSKTKSVQRN